MLNKMLRSFAVIVPALLMYCIFYIWSVISAADVRGALSFEMRNGEMTKVAFEEGGLLLKEEFEYFLEHSNEKKLKELILKDLDPINSLEYAVKKNFSILPLLRNDCSRFSCIQYRVSFDQIPTVLSRGLIGIEDFRFLDHIGLDFISIARALIKDIIARSFVEGGSTLTQQLAKNLFFTNEKSILRKIDEAILAVYIELNFSKRDILRTYFNEVNWGSLNGVRIKGVQSAARIYFGKSIEDLSGYEASILVSMLKGPYYYHPINRTERLRKRADFIFGKLKKLNHISSSPKWDNLIWDSWLIRLNKLAKSPVLSAIVQSQKIKNTNDQYASYVLTVASESLLINLKNISDNLSVKAMVTGTDGVIKYYSRPQRGVLRSFEEERHQVGSTIQPIVFGIFQSLGKDLSDEVDTEPLTLELKSGNWTPKESHKISEDFVTLKRSLMESLNLPIVKISRELGFDKVEEKLLALLPDLKIPLAEYPAQLLGAVELTIKEQYEIYHQFITQECVEKGSYSEVVEALSDPSMTTIRRSVGKRLRDQAFFGKTGTTNKGLDNWFVAYDGQRLFVVWTGYEGNRSQVNNLPLYGSSTSFKVFQHMALYGGTRLGTLTCAAK